MTFVRDFGRWIGVVTAATVAGAVCGYVLGEVIRWMALDYVVFVREYTSIGARGGLLAGTLLAACVSSSVVRPSPATLGRVGMLIVVSVLLSAGVGALLAFAAVRVRFLTYSFVNPVHPNRIAFVVGLRWGAVVGAVVTCLLGCFHLLGDTRRERRQTGIV